MGRGAIKVEVVLLHVLAMVAFIIREPKHALLEDWIATVPQREREAQALLFVRNACDPVLTPMVSARSRLLVAEVRPRVAVLAIVFAHCAPLAFAQVRAPFLPRRSMATCFIETFLLCGADHGSVPHIGGSRSRERCHTFPRGASIGCWSCSLA
jgi:hypothetical protein